MPNCLIDDIVATETSMLLLPGADTWSDPKHGAIIERASEFLSFACVKGNLFDIQIFHTDRGSEFDNTLIDEFLESFQIRRSLSMKGCPYDNAVAESTFKMIKAEFVAGRRFDSLEQLRLELADYVHWFNHIRLHSTLGYRTPVEFRNACTLSFLSD